MKILTMVPIQPEIDFLLQAWAEKGFHTRNPVLGRLRVMHLPNLDMILACGGLGKVQFAVQTQHFLDACPGWDWLCVRYNRDPPKRYADTRCEEWLAASGRKQIKIRGQEQTAWKQ